MNIVVSANSKYMRYLYIMLASLYENNKGEEITVFVLQRDFSQEDMDYIIKLTTDFGQTVEFVHIDERRFQGLPVSEKFSMETYFRLIMAEVLPAHVEKVLYMDVDIIVRGNIREFYETDLSDYLAAVCLDGHNPVLVDSKRKLFQRDKDMRYFNAGVMLWNLNRFRRDYCFEQFMDVGKKLGFELQYADQEILNYLVYDKVMYCDSAKYNYMVWGDVRESELKAGEALIMHYAGCNPWQNGYKNTLYQIWWRHAKKTPFYMELLEENLWRELGVASEKEELLLRDREVRIIYEFAFRLKGTGRVREALSKKRGTIIIYGAGMMAEVLYEILLADEVWDCVSCVIDRAKVGRFHDRQIIAELKADEADTIIVTPVYRTKELLNEIKADMEGDSIEVVSLREWVQNIP